MGGRAVGMAVNQPQHVVTLKSADNFVMVHIHDAHVLIALVLGAGLVLVQAARRRLLSEGRARVGAASPLRSQPPAWFGRPS